MKTTPISTRLNKNVLRIDDGLIKDAHLMSLIEKACSQACQAIAPAWPLDRAIAVNPHWSRIEDVSTSGSGSHGAIGEHTGLSITRHCASSLE